MITGIKLTSNFRTLFNPETRKAIPNNTSNPSQPIFFNNLIKFTKRIMLPATTNIDPSGKIFGIK